MNDSCSFAYDSRGRPQSINYPGSVIESYTYSRPAHTDPRARRPHGHVPGVTNPDGTPWLPIRARDQDQAMELRPTA